MPVHFVMLRVTRDAQCEPVVHIEGQFREARIRLDMMGVKKTMIIAAMLTGIGVTAEYLCAPLLIVRPRHERLPLGAAGAALPERVILSGFVNSFPSAPAGGRAELECISPVEGDINQSRTAHAESIHSLEFPLVSAEACSATANRCLGSVKRRDKHLPARPARNFRSMSFLQERKSTRMAAKPLRGKTSLDRESEVTILADVVDSGRFWSAARSAFSTAKSAFRQMTILHAFGHEEPSTAIITRAFRHGLALSNAFC